MRLHHFSLGLLALVLSLSVPAAYAAPQFQASAEIYFSPRGGCTEAIVNALGAAKQTVLVQAYSFTSKPIFAALLAAQKRGVEVQLVLDRSNLSLKSSEADAAVDAGIPVLIDSKHEIAHNKIKVIDGELVITGSFNFTHNEEANNAENLLLLRSKELAARYAVIVATPPCSQPANSSAILPRVISSMEKWIHGLSCLRASWMVNSEPRVGRPFVNTTAASESTTFASVRDG
jgi:phosphatidylserine/phosphatidylglycerophosphate/cardiolipin synthase-like enzyme